MGQVTLDSLSTFFKDQLNRSLTEKEQILIKWVVETNNK